MHALFAGVVVNTIVLAFVTFIADVNVPGIVVAVVWITFVQVVAVGFVAIAVDVGCVVDAAAAADVGCVVVVVAVVANVFVGRVILLRVVVDVVVVGAVVVVGVVAVDIDAGDNVAVFVVAATNIAVVVWLQRLLFEVVLLSFSLQRFLNISDVYLVSCLLCDMLI